jgi:hypothetical protein
MHRIALTFVLGLVCALAPGGALAAGDPFTVSGVVVDATAASSSMAQNIAINEGRGRAWTTLYRRLTKTQDWPRQPALDDTALQRMIRNYVVANERRSTTRFVASMSYAFNADAVRRLLRSQNILYVDMEAKPVMVVAMAPGYSARSPWSSLWSDPKYATGAVPIVPPIGDTIDAQSLGTINFATAQWQDIEPAASRVHATDAFLAQATPGKGMITVALRRVGPGVSPPIPNVIVQVKPGESANQAYGAAADAVAAAIVDVWKGRSAIDFKQHMKLTADVRIASLADWGSLTQRLSTVPTVVEVSVLAMNTGEARISITYVGSVEQLTELAAQSNLDLSNDDGIWRLAFQEPVPTAASSSQ